MMRAVFMTLDEGTNYEPCWQSELISENLKSTGKKVSWSCELKRHTE